MVETLSPLFHRFMEARVGVAKQAREIHDYMAKSDIR
jgi:hypothetical protein